MIHNLYKERGETPLECIHRFIERFPEFKKDPSSDQKLNKFTYLGRLDPLAEGVLLVGSGENDTQQKRREEFFNLDKEYDFTAIFGFATDTYDVMGKILQVADFAKGYVEPKEMDLIKVCKVFEGEREQEYPAFSSKIQAWNSPEDRHQGSKKCVVIHKLEFKKIDTLSHKELFGRLLMDISKVRGDFRQNEILILWKQILLDSGAWTSHLAHFSASVSSGTYIRGLVNDLGKTLGIGATTLSIKRTRVGDYKIEDSLRF